MSSGLLSSEEIKAIEARFSTGTLLKDDMKRLLFTVRSLLGASDVRKTAEEGAEPEKEKAPEPATPGHSIKRAVKAEVFTDGACQGNPGPGGWGAIVRIGRRTKEISGAEARTTNNRMEMTAIIEALKELPPGSHVVLTTDSQYVQKGITQWIKNWKRNGWKNAAKEPVKNADLWKILDELNRKHVIEWRWVRGHAGHRENERCDELARKAIQSVLKP